MGNWRTVQIEGTCATEHVLSLRKACSYNEETLEGYHCLSLNAGLCGLGDWIGATISARGNLAERDYSVEDVAKQLEELAKAAPSLAVRVHCGDEREDEKCVATITLVAGKAVIGPPLIEKVDGHIDDATLQQRLLAAMRRRGI